MAQISSKITRKITFSKKKKRKKKEKSPTIFTSENKGIRQIDYR